MSERPLRIVLTGGGTGGHVIPAIAVAEEIARRGGEARFVGTADRIEARLVPQAGFPIDFIRVRPLRGGGARHVIRGVAALPVALASAASLLHRLRPDVVIGVGGYVSGPVVLAAAMLRMKTALLEQNATVGFSNEVLARLVDRAFVTYPETASSFPAGRVEVTGNPVKRVIVEAAAKRRGRSDNERVRIVVMGGSQGARTIDERVPEAISRAGIEESISVLHQCGPGRTEAVTQSYRDLGIDATVVPFIEDTATAFLEADLVVARSGATTVSEVLVMGLPAIFLPYPHHTDRQQEKNAEPMRRAGAAVVLDERRTGVSELAQAIGAFVRDREYRKAAASAAEELARPDAAKSVVDGLWELGRRTA